MNMDKQLSLKGKLLLAMPNMSDPRFHKAVIFICSDDIQGAMGITINQPMANMNLGDLFDELKCKTVFESRAAVPVLAGGPVETTRGFLLHTRDYDSPETIRIDEKFAITATIESLQAFAEGKGPKDVIFALGYAGWGKGQLEQEILDNAWLVIDADYELIFNTEATDKWDRAMSRQGIDPLRLSGFAGHA